MSDLEKQKKLTEGKGWKNIDFSRVVPYKVIQGAVDTLIPTTVKKVGAKIQKIKDKKKRGPRDE